MAQIYIYILGFADKVKDMSDENGHEIGVNVYDDNDEDELVEDEEVAVAPEPVEIVREEIVTVTKNSDTEDNDDLYEVVKVHSNQINLASSRKKER
jgi:hypothetical protein